jgi:Tol biopolymer transport system component
MHEPGDRLDSWKEIARYLGRGVTTVQRWEQEEGLPVHRLPHSKKGSVYAFKQEVDGWRSARTQAPSRAGADDTAESRRPLHFLVTAVGLAALTLVALGIYRGVGGDSSSAAIATASVWDAMVPKMLANDSKSETAPSLSPDGRLVVYRWAREGAPGLYIKPVVGGTATPLALGDAVRFSTASRPKWSPTGDVIAFLNVEQEGLRGVYVVPTTGGTPRRLTSAAGIGLCWTPDGKSLGFVDRNSNAEPFSIFVADRETGQRRRLTAPPAGSFGDTHCSFSPDGRKFAAARYISRYQADVYVGDLDSFGGDEPHPVTQEASGIDGLDWTPDGESILFGTSVGLWIVPSAATTPQKALRITGSGSRIVSPTFSRPHAGEAPRLAYEQVTLDVNIWQWRADDAHHTEAIARLPGSTQWEDHPAISADGRRIAFASNRTGANEIWTADTDGGNQRQLTYHGGPVVVSPQWSPDGQRLAFTSQVGGNRDVYVIRADGSGSMRLTTEPSQEENPSWSRDGQWIYVQSNRHNIAQIWRIPAAGGTPVRVTTGEGSQGFESPDGKLLYFVRGTDAPGVWSVPVAGGKESLVLSEAREGHWAVADTGIAFIAAAAERSSLRFFDFATRTVRTLATLPGTAWTGFAISRDARIALWSRPDSSQSDLMLIDPWKP